MTFEHWLVTKKNRKRDYLYSHKSFKANHIIFLKAWDKQKQSIEIMFLM